MEEMKIENTKIRQIITEHTKTKFIEVENDRGEAQLGRVDRMTDKGELVVTIISNGKVLVFKPEFPIR